MPLAPKKINPYILFDFETGGLDDTKHPIMELAAIGIDGVTLDEILRYDDLVKPYDDLEYTPGALTVNGLSVDQCNLKGIPLKELMDNFCQLAKETNIHKTKTAKPILVAHNADFDRGFLQAAAKRTNTDLSPFIDGDFDPYGNFIPHVIDSIDWAKACWAPVTEQTTKFKLSACCEKAQVEYVDGHKAMNDCESLLALFRYLLTRLRSGTSEVVVTEGKAVATHRQMFEW